MILTLYVTPTGNEAYYCPVCEEGAEGKRTGISGFGACDGCGRERFSYPYRPADDDRCGGRNTLTRFADADISTPDEER